MYGYFSALIPYFLNFISDSGQKKKQQHQAAFNARG